MVSEELLKSIEGVFQSQPERSDMIIKTMNTMPSVGQDDDMTGTIRTFLHLNQVSNYVDRFLTRKGADPVSFAPPSKPKSVSLSQRDTELFVNKTIDFSLQNWDKTQQQALLASNFKAEVSTKQDAEFKGLAIKLERANASDNRNFLNNAQENLKNVKDAMASREALKGAVRGFLTGGHAGAVKGYCSGAVARLAKNKRNYDFMAKSDKSAERDHYSTFSAGPKR